MNRNQVPTGYLLVKTRANDQNRDKRVMLSMHFHQRVARKVLSNTSRWHVSSFTDLFQARLVPSSTWSSLLRSKKTRLKLRLPLKEHKTSYHRRLGSIHRSQAVRLHICTAEFPKSNNCHPSFCSLCNGFGGRGPLGNSRRNWRNQTENQPK